MVIHPRRRLCCVPEKDPKRESTMPKALCMVGAVVAALLLLVFGFDLILGFPFRQASLTMDIGIVLCSLALGYLSWTTLKEQK